jgi:hypothetical protein
MTIAHLLPSVENRYVAASKFKNHALVMRGWNFGEAQAEIIRPSAS